MRVHVQVPALETGLPARLEGNAAVAAPSGIPHLNPCFLEPSLPVPPPPGRPVLPTESPFLSSFLQAWEVQNAPPEQYWGTVPIDVQPLLHFYNIPVSVQESDKSNPLNILRHRHQPGDYTVSLGFMGG